MLFILSGASTSISLSRAVDYYVINEECVPYVNENIWKDRIEMWKSHPSYIDPPVLALNEAAKTMLEALKLKALREYF